MDSEQEKWMQFCDQMCTADPCRHIIASVKVHRFVCYQMFREEKPRGGKKDLLKNNTFFDEEDCLTVTGSFEAVGGVLHGFPSPKKPIGMSAFTSQRAALKLLFHNQQARCTHMMPAWEHIWLPHLKILRDHVKMRKAKIKKTNCEEKVDGEFTPCAIVEQCDEREESTWVGAHNGNNRFSCNGPPMLLLHFVLDEWHPPKQTSSQCGAFGLPRNCSGKTRHGTQSA